MTFKTVFAGAGALLTAGAAHAGQVQISIDLPQASLAEYHRPYVAGWIETAAGQPAGADGGAVFVWYDQRKPNNGGAKWLSDLRTWWRKSGRTLNLPMDGLSGATRAPGRQTLTLESGASAFKTLPPGAYQFVVEAARENGGHSLVKAPFVWNGKAFSATAATTGELGAVSLAYRP
jgi:hypothetical protein